MSSDTVYERQPTVDKMIGNGTPLTALEHQTDTSGGHGMVQTQLVDCGLMKEMDRVNIMGPLDGSHESKAQILDEIKLDFVIWARDKGIFSFEGNGRPTKQDISEAYEHVFMPNVILKKVDCDPNHFQKILADVKTTKSTNQTNKLDIVGKHSNSKEQVDKNLNGSYSIDYKKILSDLSKKSDQDSISSYSHSISGGVKVIGQVVKMDDEDSDNFEKQGLVSTSSPQATCASPVSKNILPSPEELQEMIDDEPLQLIIDLPESAKSCSPEYIYSDNPSSTGAQKKRKYRRKRYTTRRRTKQTKQRTKTKHSVGKSGVQSAPEHSDSNDIYNFTGEEDIDLMSGIKLNQAFPRPKSKTASDRVKSKYILGNYKKNGQGFGWSTTHAVTVRKPSNTSGSVESSISEEERPSKRRRKMAKPQKSIKSLEDLSKIEPKQDGSWSGMFQNQRLAADLQNHNWLEQKYTSPDKPESCISTEKENTVSSGALEPRSPSLGMVISSQHPSLQKEKHGHKEPRRKRVRPQKVDVVTDGPPITPTGSSPDISILQSGSNQPGTVNKEFQGQPLNMVTSPGLDNRNIEMNGTHMSQGARNLFHMPYSEGYIANNQPIQYVFVQENLPMAMPPLVPPRSSAPPFITMCSNSERREVVEGENFSLPTTNSIFSRATTQGQGSQSKMGISKTTLTTSTDSSGNVIVSASLQPKMAVIEQKSNKTISVDETIDLSSSSDDDDLPEDLRQIKLKYKQQKKELEKLFNLSKEKEKEKQLIGKRTKETYDKMKSISEKVKDKFQVENVNDKEVINLDPDDGPPNNNNAAMPTAASDIKTSKPLPPKAHSRETSVKVVANNPPEAHSKPVDYSRYSVMKVSKPGPKADNKDLPVQKNTTKEIGNMAKINHSDSKSVKQSSEEVGRANKGKQQEKRCRKECGLGQCHGHDVPKSLHEVPVSMNSGKSKAQPTHVDKNKQTGNKRSQSAEKSPKPLTELEKFTTDKIRHMSGNNTTMIDAAQQQIQQTIPHAVHSAFQPAMMINHAHGLPQQMIQVNGPPFPAGHPSSMVVQMHSNQLLMEPQIHPSASLNKQQTNSTVSSPLQGSQLERHAPPLPLPPPPQIHTQNSQLPPVPKLNKNLSTPPLLHQPARPQSPVDDQQQNMQVQYAMEMALLQQRMRQIEMELNVMSDDKPKKEKKRKLRLEEAAGCTADSARQNTTNTVTQSAAAAASQPTNSQKIPNQHVHQVRTGPVLVHHQPQQQPQKPYPAKVASTVVSSRTPNLTVVPQHLMSPVRPNFIPHQVSLAGPTFQMPGQPIQSISSANHIASPNAVLNHSAHNTQVQMRTQHSHQMPVSSGHHLAPAVLVPVASQHMSKQAHYQMSPPASVPKAVHSLPTQMPVRIPMSVQMTQLPMPVQAGSAQPPRLFIPTPHQAPPGLVMVSPQGPMSPPQMIIQPDGKVLQVHLMPTGVPFPQQIPGVMANGQVRLPIPPKKQRKPRTVKPKPPREAPPKVSDTNETTSQVTPLTDKPKKRRMITKRKKEMLQDKQVPSDPQPKSVIVIEPSVGQPKEEIKMSSTIICNTCRMTAQFVCSGCKLVAYCSMDCQAAAWKTHSKACHAK